MAKTSKRVKKKRTPSAAFMKPVTPDEKLAKVVGEKPLPRTELTKKLWVYIRKNGLQDAKKRTMINGPMYRKIHLYGMVFPKKKRNDYCNNDKALINANGIKRFCQMAGVDKMPRAVQQ